MCRNADPSPSSFPGSAATNNHSQRLPAQDSRAVLFDRTLKLTDAIWLSPLNKSRPPELIKKFARASTSTFRVKGSIGGLLID